MWGRARSPTSACMQYFVFQQPASLRRGAANGTAVPQEASATGAAQKSRGAKRNGNRRRRSRAPAPWPRVPAQSAAPTGAPVAEVRSSTRHQRRESIASGSQGANAGGEQATGDAKYALAGLPVRRRCPHRYRSPAGDAFPPAGQSQPNRPWAPAAAEHMCLGAIRFAREGLPPPVSSLSPATC
jgi:hypothetical protein